MSVGGAFDLVGPCPAGRLAIEASAGTGKTYALSALAARYVVEQGVGIGEIVVVTFTRAAAAELRERIRERLTAVVDALADADGGGDDPAARPRDEVLAHLCARDPVERLERARTALADFDAANITTIHGFVQQVLGTLGVSAPGDPDATLRDDGGELLRQVCTDTLVAEALRAAHPVSELPTLVELMKAARDVTGNPGIQVVPGPDSAASNEGAALRRRLLDTVIAELGRRRRGAGEMSFDEVLTRLRDALADPGSGAATRAELRNRFRVALIDEFQDTDPVQWQIFDELFVEPGRDGALVLVGDPKQAIYGFRGANVHTYLEAIRRPDTRQAVLGTNWRSDPLVLEGLEVLLRGATFGDSRIGFHRVEAAEDHRERQLRRGDQTPLPGVALRLVVGADLPRNSGGAKDITAGAAERAVYGDLASAVRDLLEEAILPEGDGRPARPVSPNDVAVLVSSHNESPDVRDALLSLGIPAVIARGDSVLNSLAARQWRWLLEAVSRPADPQRARTAALSWFVGWTADELVDASDVDLAQVQEQLHGWADILASRGVAEFFRAVWSHSGVAARVLATTDGDRAMTDLEHLAELLAANAPGRTGPAGLLETLDELTLDTNIEDVEVDAAARRIESEDDAVQIMTVHASKGLEFPVACVPTMWRGRPATARSTIFQDPVDGRRTVDVANGQQWPTKSDAAARKQLANRDTVGQNLRLLYVALTRARHQTLVWWTRAQGSNATGLARVLFARDGLTIDPEAFDAPKVALPPDDDAAAELQPLVERVGGALSVAVVGSAPAAPRRWAKDALPAPPELVIATLDHVPDRTRRRWSFSAITARAGHRERTPLDPLDDTLGDTGASDEAAGDEPVDDATAREELAPGGELPLGPLAGGTAFGTLVHGVLEHVDFAAPDLEEQLHAAVTDATVREGLVLDEDTLVAGLVAALTTPLGPQLGERSLRGIVPADRLDELAFEITVGEAGRPADDAAVARLLMRHLAADDPLGPWAAGLAEGRFGALLAGHLVGSIDVVLRIEEPGTPPRFVVADYKTNTLSLPGAPPTIGDYHPDRLPEAMAGHHYPLQALLYSVAVHRYLRWRLPDYDPSVHLGGVAYLFVRGMVGPDTPRADGRPYGVFSWAVPPVLVEELSDLLDGRESSEAAVAAGATS